MLTAQNIKHFTLQDAIDLWKSESENLRPTHPAFPYRYQQQIASSARSLIIALVYRDTLAEVPATCSKQELRSIAGITPLLALYEGNIDELAKWARAVFLHQCHGIKIELALEHSSEEIGLTKGVRKAANNVATAARRMIFFFRNLLTPQSEQSKHSDWPDFLPSPEFKFGMTLYNQIRRYHEDMGILDPGNATSQSLQRSVRKYTESSKRKRSAKEYNKFLRSLMCAVEKGHISDIEPKLFESLRPIAINEKY